MFTHRRLGALMISALLMTVSGCQGSGSRRASAPEPALSGALDQNQSGPIVDSAPSKTVTYVDRHPMLSKPREYWDSSGDNKVVKAAAATFIGVPVGIYGEMKQIVVGTPPATR
jgi:hypothetical protein